MAEFVEGRRRCGVYPPFGPAVECVFEEALAPVVLDALTRYVRVTGHAELDLPSGRIKQLRMADLEVLDDDELFQKQEQSSRSRRKKGAAAWTIENREFNLRKNDELHWEHASSTDPERLKACYYLLHIARLILQAAERGSLPRRLAAAQGTAGGALLGGLKPIARRLLEDLRPALLPEDPGRAMQIRFDDSSRRLRRQWLSVVLAVRIPLALLADAASSSRSPSP